jgi:hypothetical protein
MFVHTDRPALQSREKDFYFGATGLGLRSGWEYTTITGQARNQSRWIQQWYLAA